MHQEAQPVPFDWPVAHVGSVGPAHGSTNMAVSRELLEVRLLGGFSAEYEGEPLPPLPSRSARLLFAWLVLNAGRAQPRSLLADRFWPDAAEARARRRLSKVRSAAAGAS